MADPPKCLASTRDSFVKPLPESNLFRDAKFSADGTAIITHNEDQKLRTFILPSDLLDGSEKQKELTPYSTLNSPSNILSYALYPHFKLSDPATTWVLSGSVDVPLQLSNALDYAHISQKYNLISPTTEEYIRPYSLTFTPDGSNFIAGSKTGIYVFDHAHPEGPVTTQKLARKSNLDPNALNIKGLVSALTISPSTNLLAAGTTLRSIGLVDNAGRGRPVACFSLIDHRPHSPANTSTSDALPPIRGTGITHLRWSPSGTYLLVGERQSDAIQVFDVRNLHRRVACLTGRRALTAQKLGFDVLATADGCEVWAGGTDGVVRRWKGVGMVEGAQGVDGEMGGHDDAVSGTVWHPSGLVLATCSGQRRFRRDCDGSSDDSDSESNSSSSSSSEEDDADTPDTQSSASSRQARIPDNSLKIWDMQGTLPGG